MTARGFAFFVVLGIVGFACSDDPEPPAQPACRPPPRTSVAPVALAPSPVFGDLVFTNPSEIVEGPGGRFYVLEQKGIVVAVANGQRANALDITSKVTSGGEAGLLGIAVDPAFAQNGFIYLHFNQIIEEKPDAVFQTVIARYESKDGGATFDAATEKRLLVVDQPYANHNGGKMAFGPDGFLYIALGDGGSGGDPQGNAQNKDVILGKILRIDPKGGDPYAIPPGNPFAAGGGRPEVYAYGLRNPWKMSFDRLTGDLWAADVGQRSYEEVNKIVLGGNYGWNIREGKHCYNAATCSTEGLIDPIAEYGRADGLSVSGGYVYRGTKIPALVGKFIYGDFGSGQIWAVDEGQGVPSLLVKSNAKISTFAQDSEGEVYVADYVGGKISALVPAAEPAPEIALTGAKLSETGCVDLANPREAPSRLVAYSVASPLWSDGADKERFLFVPDGKKVGVLPDGDLDIPPGSVAVKTFLIDGRRIETRLFVRYEDASWAGYSYEWSDDQKEATLLADGKTKELPGGKSWTFPSRADCFACHTPVAGFTLGLEARQLNTADQLDRLASLFDQPIAKEAFPPLRAADGEGTDEERARGYLHANCSHCHRAGSGAGAATIDLRIDRSFADTRTCNVAPQAGDVGVADAKIFTPGAPEKSTLALRMRSLDPIARMPNVATRVVDDRGVAAVEAWIRSVGACP